MKVWREGDRIRRDNGSGYGDLIPDEVIEQHRAAVVANLEAAQQQIAFCEAVLAFRAGERAARGASGVTE